MHATEKGVRNMQVALSLQNLLSQFHDGKSLIKTFAKLNSCFSLFMQGLCVCTALSIDLHNLLEMCCVKQKSLKSG